MLCLLTGLPTCNLDADMHHEPLAEGVLHEPQVRTRPQGKASRCKPGLASGLSSSSFLSTSECSIQGSTSVHPQQQATWPCTMYAACRGSHLWKSVCANYSSIGNPSPGSSAPR